MLSAAHAKRAACSCIVAYSSPYDDETRSETAANARCCPASSRRSGGLGGESIICDEQYDVGSIAGAMPVTGVTHDGEQVVRSTAGQDDERCSSDAENVACRAAKPTAQRRRRCEMSTMPAGLLAACKSRADQPIRRRSGAASSPSEVEAACRWQQVSAAGYPNFTGRHHAEMIAPVVFRPRKLGAGAFQPQGADRSQNLSSTMPTTVRWISRVPWTGRSGIVVNGVNQSACGDEGVMEETIVTPRYRRPDEQSVCRSRGFSRPFC